MEIAIIEYFDSLGYEVWLTDRIEINSGLGSVFDTKQEALEYVKNNNAPLLDLSDFAAPILEGDELRAFLSQYLEMTPHGEVISIK